MNKLNKLRYPVQWHTIQNKKEWTIDSHNMNQSRLCHAEWKKLAYILYNFNLYGILEKHNYRNRERTNGFQGLGEKEGRLLRGNMQQFCREIKLFCIPVVE